MSKTKNQRPNSGKEYERIVAEIHRQFSGNALVTENEKIKGKSGIKRQIDVTLRTQIADSNILVIIDCKDHGRKVDINKVDGLIGVIQDVGANKGIIVSDSGFSAGAIKRAKADKRIQLTSVIDTDNGKLRSNLYLPIGVQCHDLKELDNITVIIPPHSSLNPISIEEKQIIEFIRRFYIWCGNNTASLPAGDHSYSDEVLKNDSVTVIGKIIFQKTIRYFVNTNIYAKGVGIYDHASMAVIEGNTELKTIHLDRDEILATWPEVPKAMPLKGCKSYYVCEARYDINSAEDMGRRLFSTLKANVS